MRIESNWPESGKIGGASFCNPSASISASIERLEEFGTSGISENPLSRFSHPS